MTEKRTYNTDGFKRAAARLVRYYRGGEDARWHSAVAAVRIVGRYERGATRELAGELAVSPDAIEALARAYIVYRSLRMAARALPEPERDMFRAVSELRGRLTVSHFAEVGRLMKAHDLTSLDVFAILQQAAEFPRTPVARMGELVAAENGGDKSATWQEQARGVYIRLLNISTNGAAPAWLAKLATDWADVLLAMTSTNEKVVL